MNVINFTIPDLNSCTMSSLHRQARTMGLTGFHNLNKEELIALIENTPPAEGNDTGSYFSRSVHPCTLKKAKEMGSQAYSELKNKRLLELVVVLESRLGLVDVLEYILYE